MFQASQVTCRPESKRHTVFELKLNSTNQHSDKTATLEGKEDGTIVYWPHEFPGDFEERRKRTEKIFLDLPDETRDLWKKDGKWRWPSRDELGHELRKRPSLYQVSHLPRPSALGHLQRPALLLI